MILRLSDGCESNASSASASASPFRAHYRIRILLYAGKPNWEPKPRLTCGGDVGHLDSVGNEPRDRATADDFGVLRIGGDEENLHRPPPSRAKSPNERRNGTERGRSSDLRHGVPLRCPPDARRYRTFVNRTLTAATLCIR